MTDHRRPPMPTGLPRAGACRWCALPINYPEGHKLAGQPNMRRTWCSEAERDCVWRYKLATGSDTQRSFCFKRDKGVCAGCGVKPHLELSVVASRIRLGWRPGMKYDGVEPDDRNLEIYLRGWRPVALVIPGEDDEEDEDAPPQPEHELATILRHGPYTPEWKELIRRYVVGPFEPIHINREWVGEWDADHIRLLWSRPDDLAVADRDAWFGPDNLQTLCQKCHKAKSRREAAQRADLKRAGKLPGLPARQGALLLTCEAA